MLYICVLKQLVYGGVKGGRRYGDLAGCYAVTQVAMGIPRLFGGACRSDRSEAVSWSSVLEVDGRMLCYGIKSVVHSIILIDISDFML